MCSMVISGVRAVRGGGMSDTFAYVAMAVCPVVILFDIVSTDRQTDTADVILSTVMYCR